jgi:CBS domain containing-hemolysin-like protein
MDSTGKKESSLRFGIISRTIDSFRRFADPSAYIAVPMGVNSSQLDDSKKEMIRGVLDLESMVVRDVMIPRIDIFAVKAGTGLRQFIQIASEAGHSRIPVYDETIDNIVGIVYIKDLLPLIIAKPKRFDLRKIIHKPLFVPETMALDELLIQFKKRRLHLAIAIDEYGGVAGLVTMENIIEEIVGDIQDEYDDPELARFVKKNVREFEADARLSLSDFSEKTGIPLPFNEFDTVGGYILDLFGRIPLKGESIKNDGNILFRVIEIRGTRMSRVLVTLPPPEKE